MAETINMVKCYECFQMVPREQAYVLPVSRPLFVCSIKCLKHHTKVTRINTRLRLKGRTNIEIRPLEWQLRSWS